MNLKRSADLIIMSRQLERFVESLGQFKAADEVLINEMKPYITSQVLSNIYANDQKMGESIHDAYRNAIQAGIENKENFDELVATLESSQAVLTASGNLGRVTCLFR